MLRKTLTYLLLALAICSCTEYGRITRSGSVEDKYQAAIKYYQEKEYYKCTSLMESIISYISGGEEFVDALFVFAESYFYQKDYVMAEYYYQKFVGKFPRNEKVQQAEYMIAKSQYMQSPKTSLDQTQTLNAINSLQAYLNKYPKSENSQECSNLIDELSMKIEDKAYSTAKLHLKIRNYKAAVTSFDIFARDFPSSKKLEETSFLKLQAEYELAKISLESIKEEGKIILLQKERYKKVIEYYFDFMDAYPSSRYTKEAQNYYKTALSFTENK
jgi:outer membrane protein assembly factor BamD